MDFTELVRILDQVIKHEIFTIQGQPITLMDGATFTLIILVTLFVSRFMRRSANRALDRRGIDDPGTRAITGRVINIVVLLIGFATALQNIGINLAALFAAGAVFAVGISFAFQNVAQNFLSGLILLFERSIKPDDVLEVEGEVVRVERLGIRSTVARTRDDEQIIIPNTVLAQGSVKNYTMEDSLYRVIVPVGVTYSSDMKQVRQVLESTVEGLGWAVPTKPPIVLLTGFADSAVTWDVAVWTDDPWLARRVQSKLHEAVWFALKEAGITIAFPQLDVHFDPVVEDAVERLPRAS